MRLRTAFLWLLIGSLSLAAAMGIAVLLLPHIFGYQSEVLGSAALVSAFSLIGLICSIGLDRRRLVPVMWVGIAASVVAVAVWLTMIWTGWPFWSGRREIEEMLFRIGWTGTTMALWAAITAVLLLWTSEQRVVKRLLQSGAIVSAIVAAAVIGAVWLDADDWFWFGVFGSYATLLAWTAWFLLIVRVRLKRPISRLVQMATCAAGSALALWLVLRSWDVPATEEEWMLRVAGVLLILSAVGSIIVAILPRLDRTADAATRESIPSRLHIEIVCPRCSTPQQMKTGHSRCRACGLRFEIDIEEPRCDCGYLLHKLEGERCPECGRVIPETDRWAAVERPREAASGGHDEYLPS